MKIVAISDTHSHHRSINIPDGDVFVCAGDITFRGELPVIEDFSNWVKELPHKNKIVIFGNHELGMEAGKKRQPALDMVANAGITYLEDSGIEIDGIKFWGSPVTPTFHNWEWNRQRGKDIDFHWRKIPLDTNVLITHGPPINILDAAPRGFGEVEHVGCEDLLRTIDGLKNIKVHIFGHIHRDNNEAPVERNGVKFCNVSILNNNYKFVTKDERLPINTPIVIEI